MLHQTLTIATTFPVENNLISGASTPGEEMQNIVSSFINTHINCILEQEIWSAQSHDIKQTYNDLPQRSGNRKNTIFE